MNESHSLSPRRLGGGGAKRGGWGVSEEFLGGNLRFSGGTKVGSVTTVNQQNKGHTTQRVNRTLNEQ